MNPTNEQELREQVLTEFKQVHKLAPADYTENCTNIVMSLVEAYITANYTPNSEVAERERTLGIDAGLEIGSHATKTVVYTDRGISAGMRYGIARAVAEGRPVEYRSLRKIQL